MPGPDRDAALAYATDLLGEVRVEHDHSWPHGESTVRQVVDAAGARRIVKQVRSERHYAGEVTGLTSWAPALGPGRAPQLLGADDASQTVVTTCLIGVVGAAGDPDAHRQAGALAAGLHAIGPRSVDVDHSARLAAQVDRWAFRAPGAFEPADLDFVRGRVRELDGLPAPERTSIHNDYQPRNWIVDHAGSGGGRVAVIDFGRSGLDLLLRDVERLWFAEWVGHPQLRDAFFDGYGRALTPDEIATVEARGAFQAGGTIVWSIEHGDPAFEQTGRDLLSRLRGRAI